MTPSINEQLNIPILPDGIKTYQPDQFGGNLEDFGGYRSNIIVGTAYYSRADGNKNGWANCCGNFTGEQDYNYDVGNISFCTQKCLLLHPRNKTKQNTCLAECQEKHGGSGNVLQDLSGGAIPSGSPLINATNNIGLPKTLSPDSDKKESNPSESTDLNTPKKMSTGLIIGLSIGGLAIIGGIIYLVKKRNAKK